MSPRSSTGRSIPGPSTTEMVWVPGGLVDLPTVGLHAMVAGLESHQIHGNMSPAGKLFPPLLQVLAAGLEPAMGSNPPGLQPGAMAAMRRQHGES